MRELFSTRGLADKHRSGAADPYQRKINLAPYGDAPDNPHNEPRPRVNQIPTNGDIDFSRKRDKILFCPLKFNPREGELTILREMEIFLDTRGISGNREIQTDLSTLAEQITQNRDEGGGSRKEFRIWYRMEGRRYRSCEKGEKDGGAVKGSDADENEIGLGGQEDKNHICAQLMGNDYWMRAPPFRIRMEDG
ncbi:hypothetical protein NPIL_619661 [Nephila pilipes]|uniref:Uncharacterized protein n=1 Tax=Nephila pilipes TaxID=299642 RepID=A0A8X6TLX2_NEPPI|nr:hypothetical protein NPIL_619661 [Nephila pilipes]